MRLVALTRLFLFSVALAGCYTLQPAAQPEAPSPNRMAFDINDVGRVALGGSMGPEIAQIEGHVISFENGEYDVAVAAVRLLNGGEQVWRGERVHIKKDFVKTTYERRFSRGRTIALSAAVVGGVALIMGGHGLIGLGTEGPSGPQDTVNKLRRP